jgi:hypothetical protein
MYVTHAAVRTGGALGAACAATSGRTFLPCVTSPGVIKTGGALFIDLPANILGS